MEQVKLAGLGPHAPAILYSGGRPQSGPIPGAQVSSNRPHEGSPYKTSLSPVSRTTGVPVSATYCAYPPPPSDSHTSSNLSGHRYVTQYVTYPKEPQYPRSMHDRSVFYPHQRRPTIMGSSFRPYSRTDLISNVITGNPAGVSLDNRKPRLAHPMKADLKVPLAIDTSENSTKELGYYPKVEAISPTQPNDGRDESPSQSTGQLMQRIETVNLNIEKVKSSISKLKKKKEELELAAQKGDSGKKEEEEEDLKEGKHQNIAQEVYAENRKKADESHAILGKLFPQSDCVLPLYHQPSDTATYQENKRNYAKSKRKLIEYFKKRLVEKNEQEQQLTQTYSKLMAGWLTLVDKVENSKKSKEKVAKSRELFEKVFPELRKQREDKERFSRVGARVKSEAEMDEIIDGLQEQLNEDKKMKAYAVVPPLLLDQRQIRYSYINKNGLIEDPIGEFRELKNINIWTETEKEIFRDKYLQHPKNFVLIGSALDRKSVCDCIQYYYNTKKQENYKMLVKRRIRRPRNRGGNHQPVGEVVGINSTGVTTRSSVRDTHQQPFSTGEGNGDSESICDSMMENGAVYAQIDGDNVTEFRSTTSPRVGAPATSLANSDSVSSGVPVLVSEENSMNFSTQQNTEGHMSEKDKENLSSNNSGASEKACRSAKDGERDAYSSEDESMEVDSGGKHECAVCKMQLDNFRQSYAILPSHAANYGLSEDLLPPNARACHTCKNRAFGRRKVAPCPLPSCPIPKWRVKRLRPFPYYWNDLPQPTKDPIIKELQIPPGVNKCCASCFSRIARHLGPNAEEPLGGPNRWSDEDIEALRKALLEFGSHWSRVCERIPTKTQDQCKSFYYNFKGKHKFDDAVAEYRRNKGKGNGPPTLTDEEESGSSTSSCDEVGSIPPPQEGRRDSASDTTSASSPGPIANSTVEEKCENIRETGIKEPLPVSVPCIIQANAKEDYDSSATASADEGQNGAGRESPDIQHIPNPGERIPLPTAKQKAPCVGDIIHMTIEASLRGGNMAFSGLDLSTKKRDRSAFTFSPVIPIKEREERVARSACDGKDPPPPRAHENSTRYSLPPDNDIDRSTSILGKSPSAFAPELRILEKPYPFSSSQPRTEVKKPSPPVPFAAAVTLTPQVLTTSGTTISRIPLKTDKTPPSSHGSITHGTPVGQHAVGSISLTPARHYDAPKNREGGSITQGTPVHHDIKRHYPAVHIKERKMIYGESSPGGGVDIIPRPPPTTNYDREGRNPRSQLSVSSATGYPFTTYSYPTRPSDPQLSSRQIMANDYHTSQQMQGRRITGEKESRVSPREREASPHSDHRLLPPGTTVERRPIEPRSVDPRVIEMHAVDYRQVEPRPLEHREIELRIAAPRIDIRTAGDRRNYYPPSSINYAQSAPQVYLAPSDSRISRPAPLPSVGRDATPTPPTSETGREFRSPGISTVTPPPSRMGSVIQMRHPIKSTSHMALPPKCSSPRGEQEHFPPRSLAYPERNSELSQRTIYSSVDLRRDIRSHSLHDHSQDGFNKQISESSRIGRPPTIDSRAVYDKDKVEIQERRVHVLPEDRRYYDYRVKEDLHGYQSKVPKDDFNDPTKVKGMPSKDGIPASLLLNNIIMGAVKKDSRVYRNEGDLRAVHILETDKCARSPTQKEKDTIIEEVTNHKDALGGGASIHAVHHSREPVSMMAHMNSIISREFADGHKTGRHLQDSHPGEAPKYPHHPQYDQRTGSVRNIAAFRVYEKERADRPPPATSGANVQPQGSHLAADERQIIRIKQQAISPRSEQKRRTPPGSDHGYEPSGLLPVASEPNHVFDGQYIVNYVNKRFELAMRTSDPDSPHEDLSRHSSVHYEEPVKKRARLEDPASHKPWSRTDKDGTSREEVADSPQSGEMVIDESPRDGKPKGISPKGEGVSYSVPPTISGGVSQFSYPYQTYRSSSGGSGAWGPSSASVPAPPASSSSSMNRFHGYEPRLEPVSDED